MSSDALELNEKARAEYVARWEAVEIFKAHELANMTEERRRQIMPMLEPFAPFEPDPLNGTGLVGQRQYFIAANDEVLNRGPAAEAPSRTQRRTGIVGATGTKDWPCRSPAAEQAIIALPLWGNHPGSGRQFHLHWMEWLPYFFLDD